MAKQNKRPANGKAKADAAEEANTPDVVTEEQKIEALKEIIFGPNMQQYSKEFHEIKSTIDQLKKETFKKIDDLRDNMEDMFKSMEQELNNRVDGLEADMNKEMEKMDDAKLNRHQMGDLLRNIADKMSA